MTPTVSKCPTCGITWTSQDVALWCKYNDCPKTDQRWPTAEQVRLYQINEPFMVQK